MTGEKERESDLRMNVSPEADDEKKMQLVIVSDQVVSRRAQKRRGGSFPLFPPLHLFHSDA